jgi:anti-anti-sigma factor
MMIETTRDGGSAVLRVEGRLDREGAEHLSQSLEELLRDGVRSVAIDLATVTYISSAATTVLSRWRQELAVLRGEVQVTSIPPAVRESLAILGWDSRFEVNAGSEPGSGPTDLRLSSWQMPATIARNGEYQMSACVADGTLRCRLHGHPDWLSHVPLGPDDCDVVALPANAFGLGLGAIGGGYDDCRDGLGELLAVAGCIAHFPNDGARMADYLVGDGAVAPRAVLASGLTCEGAFSKLVRFSTKSDVDAVPLSEVVGVCLDAVGGAAAGVVIAAETLGLSGARIRRSPAAPDASPLEFEVSALREWLSFAPERASSLTTTLAAGVVARSPEGPLEAHLRPLGWSGSLYGHFHAAVFSYRPLPQRTVELGVLVRGLFKDHQLRDVLHLVWDDRGEDGAAESTLIRGVAWVSPVTQIS